MPGAGPRGWGSTRRIPRLLLRRFEEALQEARQVDQLLAEGPGDGSLEEKFPLLGVPVTVKEAFSLHGAFALASPAWQVLTYSRSAMHSRGWGWLWEGAWWGAASLSRSAPSSARACVSASAFSTPVPQSFGGSGEQPWLGARVAQTWSL